MLPAVQPFPTRLDPNQLHGLVLQEGMEDANGVAAPADAGHDIVGQPPKAGEHLSTSFDANHALEVTH